MARRKDGRPRSTPARAYCDEHGPLYGSDPAMTPEQVVAEHRAHPDTHNEPKVIVPGSTHEELEAERARIREERRDDSERPGLEIAVAIEDEIHQLPPLSDAELEQAKARIRRPSVFDPVDGEEGQDLAEFVATHMGIDLTPQQVATGERILEDMKERGRMEVSFPFLQTDRIKGRVQMADIRAQETGQAYGGLVPRKAGEFHHHFDIGEDKALTPCVFCGNRLSDDRGPCKGPDWEAWEARMQARRDLKDRIFYLAYGRSEAGHEEAAREMAEFNAETLRLFPDRFREPTPEELQRREEFAEMIRGLSKAPIQHVTHEVSSRYRHAPLTEAEERYLAKACRQQDALNEQIRAAKEAAWDEGFAAGANHDFGDYEVAPAPIENPYRKADRA